MFILHSDGVCGPDYKRKSILIWTASKRRVICQSLLGKCGLRTQTPCLHFTIYCTKLEAVRHLLYLVRPSSHTFTMTSSSVQVVSSLSSRANVNLNLPHSAFNFVGRDQYITAGLFSRSVAELFRDVKLLMPSHSPREHLSAANL
jgi:hypothetical protein